jgi:epoxyqueuosine reductase
MPEKSAILLHVCCAPDAVVAAERLAGEFRMGAYFYNPNIFPQAEYNKREQELVRIAPLFSLTVHDAPYDPQHWLALAAGLEKEPEKGKRCEVCVRMRLQQTAQAARALGYACFGTVLTTSPFKNAGMVNALGEETARDLQLAYYASDFKKKEGFKRSLELCRQYGIYRQNYCGCQFSLR